MPNPKWKKKKQILSNTENKSMRNDNESQSVRLIESHKSLDRIKPSKFVEWTMPNREMPKISKLSLTTFNEDFYMHTIISGFSVQIQTQQTHAESSNAQ